jgi:hypothetical protein
MRPISQEFQRIVRGSHRMFARARIVAPGQTGVDPDGVEIPIVDGNTVHDGNAEIRATADLTTVWDWPRSVDGLLAPYGNELFLERGIVRENGTKEAVSQGYFRLYGVEQDNVPRGAIRLSGRDRMSGIIDARLETPIQFATGTTIADAFEFLVGAVYPGVPVEFDFDANAVAFASPHIAEEDRYGFLLDVARAQGKVMYFDYRGVLQVRSAPDPRTPVFDVDHGAGGVLVDMSRKLSRDGVYNAVVAAGETPGDIPPVRAIARDENPHSPTYYFGPFGKVPRYYSSPFITTTEQCRSAASAMLARAIGLPYNVDFRAIVNPALEPLDPVTVSYDARTPREVHVIEQLRTPLTADGVMTATTREQTRIQIGVS